MCMQCTVLPHSPLRANQCGHTHAILACACNLLRPHTCHIPVCMQCFVLPHLLCCHTFRSQIRSFAWLWDQDNQIWVLMCTWRAGNAVKYDPYSRVQAIQCDHTHATLLQCTVLPHSPLCANQCGHTHAILVCACNLLWPHTCHIPVCMQSTVLPHSPLRANQCGHTPAILACACYSVWPHTRDIPVCMQFTVLPYLRLHAIRCHHTHAILTCG